LPSIVTFSIEIPLKNLVYSVFSVRSFRIR